MSCPRKKRRHPKGGHRPMPTKSAHALPSLVHTLLRTEKEAPPVAKEIHRPPDLHGLPNRIVQALVAACGLIAVLTTLTALGLL